MSPVKSCFCVFAVCVLGLTGCGPESNVAPISGTAKFDGKPIEKGSINFVPVKGQGPTAGGIIEGGKYKCEAAVGECKVEIRMSKVVGKKKLYDTPDSPEQEVHEEVLPPKYNEATELTLDIKKGNNEKNWDLAAK